MCTGPLHTKGMCAPAVDSWERLRALPTGSLFFSSSLPALEGPSRALLLSWLCPAWVVTSLRDLDLHVQQSQLLSSSDRRAEGLHLPPPTETTVKRKDFLSLVFR